MAFWDVKGGPAKGEGEGGILFGFVVACVNDAAGRFVI